MKRLFLGLIAVFIMLTQVDASTITFYLSPGTDAIGDQSFQKAALALGAHNFLAEEDFEKGFCDVAENLSIGTAAIDILLPAILSSRADLYGGPYTKGGGVQGTLFGRAICSKYNDSKDSSILFKFSGTPVQGFGLWIFDDCSSSVNAFRMTVTASDGTRAMSNILDENHGSRHWTVEGFIGVTASSGIKSVLIENGNWDGSDSSTFTLYDANMPFDVDHLQVIGPKPCPSDFDNDGDVDGSDLAKFAADFGRTNCCGPGALPCEGNFDNDCDVDGSDLARFAKDFGRTDCPKLP